jgi:two-component system response regulator HydG
MKRPKILFVDDQKSARDLFVRLIDPSKYEAVVAAAVVEAEEQMVQLRPDVVITDLRMPNLDGLKGLERFHQIDPDVPVILITAFGTVETAVEAMKRGAFDYLRKPFEPSEIEIVIDRAVRHHNLLRENAQLRSEVERKFSRTNIICRSPAMAAVMDLVSRAAPSDFSVLIQGESGTGKDLIAKLIHYTSPRSAAPYISINCSAIPEHLLESELFGYVKGAFSGATTSKAGFFAKADGGTLFLDEIGDMSPNLQPKLLRVLHDGEYYPVGSRQLSRTNVRVICASNQDIAALVEKGSFRQDLYYRINTVRVLLPPLRERKEEIPLLVEHFFSRLRQKSPGAPGRLSVTAMRCLLEYHWPGNVRELEHAIERASLVCDSDEIQPEHLPPEVRGGESAPTEAASGNYKEARKAFEQRYFKRLLSKTGGNIQKAAEIAGIHRTTLYDKLGKLNIESGRE